MSQKQSRYQVIEHTIDELSFTVVRVIDTATITINGLVQYSEKVRVVGTGVSKRNPADPNNLQEGYKYALRRAKKNAAQNRRKLLEQISIKVS